MDNMWIQMKKHFEVRALEWFGALILTYWGIYAILHPGMMQSRLDTTPFKGMLALANQEVWGVGALIAGHVRLTALFINGRWGLTPIIRVLTSFLSVFVWFWICVGLYHSDQASFGWVIYPSLVLADVYSAFRAAGDAYEAEALKRLRLLERETQSNVTRLRG